PLAAARCCRSPLHVAAELAGDRFDFVALRRVFAAQREVHKRRAARQVWLLFEDHHARARLDRALARVGFDLVGDQLEQRGLAGPVAADQRQPVPWPDVQVEVAEKPAPALLQAQAFPGEDRCVRHRAAPPRPYLNAPQGTPGSAARNPRTISYRASFREKLEGNVTPSRYSPPI